MIKTNRLCKQYWNKEVLKDVNLEILPHTMVAILGKSGAGKSTLLHVLGTLDQPTSGDVYMGGKHTSSLDGKELSKFRNQNIGFIFQFHYLLPEFSALENICIPAWINNQWTEKEILDRAHQLLHDLGMEKYTHTKPNFMSGGEQQRISIARALINNPSYILADEPTGNLDTGTSHQFMELIVRLKKEKPFTFVMVTHNETIATMFDQQIFISDGQIS